MQKPMLMNEIKLTHEDVPGLTETFVDSLHTVMAADGIVRIEFCTTRLDEPHPPGPMTGRRTTAARLAMPAKTAVEMIALVSPHLGPQQAPAIAPQPAPPATPKH